MTKTEPQPLPDLPSDLILVALEDLEKVEQSPKYMIQMDDWHVPSTDDQGKDVCEVCLAGAVMAMRLGADPEDDALPEDYGGTLQNKLGALNNFREGYVTYAMRQMGLDENQIVATAMLNRNITDYDDDPVAFKAEMRQLAADLKAAGY